MKRNPEEAVAQVFAALRDSEAPAGMERRILEAVRDRASLKPASTWHRLRPTWPIAPAMRWSVALACTAAICMPVSLTVSRIHRTEHVPVIATAHPTSPTVLATTAQLPLPRSRGRSARKAIPPKGALVRDADAAALSDLRAASFPAPPVPLTEQERLLLRIAHKGDPVQLALLDPALRTARNTEEKAEVQRFFEPSKTGANE